MAENLDEKLIEENRLPNGMALRLYDRSKLVAGDRWVVRLRGELRVAVLPDFYDHISETEPGVLNIIREKLGSELVLTIDRERNFVAGEEREGVAAGLLARGRDNLLLYLENPFFPLKLFLRRFEELKRAVLLNREILRACGEKDDRESADFSSGLGSRN